MLKHTSRLGTSTPSIVQIDASAHCQLACPSCPTADGSTRPAMGAGHLDVSMFEQLLDRNPELAHVELSNYGEMFLNPRLRDIVRIAADRKVVLSADNGTNMNHASDETLETLVRYRFRSITVSIDGASNETYAHYRRGGDFDRVIGNIRKINEYKKKHGAAFPFLKWQFIVFGHNEHEIGTAKGMAAELGMEFRAKVSWDEEFSPVRDARLVQIQTGVPATREQYHEVAGVAYQRSICYQLWQQPVLNWNGKLTGCCRNFWGDFGTNAFEDGLVKALEAPKLRHAQKMLMGMAEPEEGVPCSTCDLYFTMRKDGNWISERELKASVAREGTTTAVTVEPGNSAATHVDIFLAAGHAVNRLLPAMAPAAKRYEIGVSRPLVYLVPAGKYTVYAVPRRLDPAFRAHYPAMPAVTMPITVPARPTIYECEVRLG